MDCVGYGESQMETTQNKNDGSIFPKEDELKPVTDDEYNAGV
jgi:hypothetical protein